MDRELAGARGEVQREVTPYSSGVDTGVVRARWVRMDFNNRFQDALAASAKDGEREGWPNSVPFVDFTLIDRAREELGDEAADAMACAVSADPC